MSTKAGHVRNWGFWTRGKLDILSDYMSAFTKACSNLAGETTYLDLFAGNDNNYERGTGRPIAGSARRAILAEPKFNTIVLLESDAEAAQQLNALAEEFPDRDVIVRHNDCNTELSAVLNELRLRGLAWRPCLAFIDPYNTGVTWEALEQLSRFRTSGKYKVELFILLMLSQVPRRLRASRDKTRLEITTMYGTDEWMAYYDGAGAPPVVPSADSQRALMANLFRWRLESGLGYQNTHQFKVKAGRGHLYDLIFATDNDTGNKIMGDLFTKNTRVFPAMAAAARRTRRDITRAAQGQDALFDTDADPVESLPNEDLYIYSPPVDPHTLWPYVGTV